MKQHLSDEFWSGIHQKLKELVDKRHRPATEVIIDDVDLRDMLKISRRTALEYRRSKLLLYYKIENKIFYFLSDVIDFIKKAGSKHE